MSETETARFRRMYCGLCHVLGRRYGWVARMILNYDFTYLAILLSEGEEADSAHGRCAASPLGGRDYSLPTPALELAAGESVILAYWQLRDEAADHSGPSRGAYQILSATLEPAYRRAAAVSPAFASSTQRQLEYLRQLEAAQCSSMDQAADTFAVLLQSAAKRVEDPVRRRVLEQLLYHLGRWIYLVDAADDLKEDAAAGRYNPVALRFGLTEGRWTPESRQAFAMTLDHSIHQIITAFALWDFGVWTPILENTFCAGLFHTGKAVLDGTFQPQKIREKRRRKTHEGSLSGSGHIGDRFR